MATSASGDPDPARDPVFARLVGELEELGFEPGRPVGHPQDTARTTVYTATDSAVTIATIGGLADAPDPHVCVTGRHGDGTAWRMRWSATTPVAVQLIALYAAVNDDPAAALEAAAAALAAPPPTRPAKPSPTAG